MATLDVELANLMNPRTIQSENDGYRLTSEQRVSDLGLNLYKIVYDLKI